MTCHNCGKFYHFASVCRSKYRNVHNVSSVNGFKQSDSDAEKNTEFCIDTVIFSSPTERAFVQINVGPSRITIHFKLDAGSAVDILPLIKSAQETQHKSPSLAPSSHLTSYTGNRLPVCGTLNLEMSVSIKLLYCR